MSYDPFQLLLSAHHLPVAQPEFRFHPPRKWRFDYAWPARLIAVECDGGAWTRGRHTRGTGFIADMEKLNQAQIDGWLVLRFTPQQLASGSALDLLKQVLA